MSESLYKGAWVYDVEIYRNFFSVCAVNITTDQVVSFYMINDETLSDDAYKWLLEHNVGIGYNNKDFDYPIIHEIILNYHKGIKVKANRLYNLAQRLIDSNERRYISNMFIKQVDLYKICHFDNAARRTSLKWLEFAMRMESIQELPYKHNTLIQREHIDDIIKYNLHDVKATLLFFNLVIDKVKFRDTMSSEYSIDFTNMNDVKIGVEIFAKELSDYSGIPIAMLKKMSTPRPSIVLADCILDSIKFESDAFKVLLIWLKRQLITDTKGVFSSIKTTDAEEIMPYICENEYANKGGKFKLTPVVKDGIIKKLAICNNGFQYDFGTGGLHGCIQPGTYRSDDEYIILDLDYSSYYPNLAIINGIRPEHLGESFATTYKSIYERRKTYPKSNPLNGALKLSLNG